MNLYSICHGNNLLSWNPVENYLTGELCQNTGIDNRYYRSRKNNIGKRPDLFPETWELAKNTDYTLYGNFGNYLSKDNTQPYTPKSGYNPATKEYVDAQYFKEIDLINGKVDLSQFTPSNLINMIGTINPSKSNLTASSALKLTTPRTISLNGDTNGNTVFDGSKNVIIDTQVISQQILPTADQVSGSTRLPDIFSVQRAYNNKNTPTTYGNILNIGGAGSGQGQIFIGWSGNSPSGITGYDSNNYIRSKRDVDGTEWSDWAKIWTDKNDGPGSKLNADLLDGLQYTQFLRSDVGQTMNGTLLFDADNQYKITLNNTINHRSSEIHFNSYINKNSDYGYIRYDDENTAYNKWGGTTENSAMVIGVGNDGQNSNSDVVALESPAGIFLNAPDIYAGDKSTLNNMHAKVFYGTSTTAKYADIAEKYVTDKEYESGTVLSVGADGKGVIFKKGSKVLGVVSTEPGYMLNSEITGQYIALKGRVPCKINGSATIKQYIIADDNGCGIAVDDYTFEQSKRLLGVAISNSKNGIVEIKV